MTGPSSDRKDSTAKPVKRSDVPLIPSRAADDSDEGWNGAESAGGFSDDWYREQRPPHW